jgi:hypothetical protein
MQKYRPLIASLAVIVVALIVIGVVFRDQPAPDNTAADDNATTDNESDNEDEVTWTKIELEDLPSMDPVGFWPRPGMRLSHPDVWVTWMTPSSVQGRLIARGEGTTWYDLGRTHGEVHYLPMDLSVFGSSATFMVEHEYLERRVRSSARSVTFGAGVHFTRRRARLTLEDTGRQMFELQVSGGNPTELRNEAWSTSVFAPEIRTFVVAVSGDEYGGTIKFGVDEALTVGGAGALGFLQVFDIETMTYDRILIELVWKR